MLRQIRYFQSVVRNNSFSEAAEECHISQSAISQQVKALETELGFPLLERKNRKFVLTPAGEHFYKKSLVLVADYEQLCRESARNPVAALPSVTTQELKNIPCILVTSQGQRDNEKEFYQTVIGIQGEILYAENLEEARMMVLSGQGFLPVEGNGRTAPFGGAMRRVPLCRGEKPVTRNYCLFWKKGNAGCYVETFSDMLRQKFE